MKLFGKTKMLLAAILTIGLSARADTVSLTFAGTPTGVNDGPDYVTPYLVDINGIPADVTCYDLFDDVYNGQSWTANALTLQQAEVTGQFSGAAYNPAGYEEVAFLSQQKTNSAENQVDLQHDIWNVFAPNRYSVTTGMQTYLNLITPSAYAAFNFSTIRFLEDANQTPGQVVQALVVDLPATAPEPGTILLMGAGALLIGAGSMKRRKLIQPFSSH